MPRALSSRHQGREAQRAKTESRTESRMGAHGSLKNRPWCGHGLRMKVLLFSSDLPIGDENIKPCHRGGWASQNRAGGPPGGQLGSLTTAILILPEASCPSQEMDLGSSSTSQSRLPDPSPPVSNLSLRVQLHVLLLLFLLRCPLFLWLCHSGPSAPGTAAQRSPKFESSGNCLKSLGWVRCLLPFVSWSGVISGDVWV